MLRIKKHGNPPFSLVLVHGGPGAAGELGGLSSELSIHTGIIEPYQTRLSIKDLIIEINEVICRYADSPVILAGFSWGAWLSGIYTAKYPNRIRKLILISCPPFVNRDFHKIIGKRLERLTAYQKMILDRNISRLKRSDDIQEKDRLFKKIGKIISKADSFDPQRPSHDSTEYDYEIFDSIWKEARLLRESGRLLELMLKIDHRIVIIHGDHDPHPIDGVVRPLEEAGKDIKVKVLKQCGHYPWRERKARKKFLDIMREEIRY